MFRQLILRNFKSFGDSTIAFGPLTLILGANASGKSNLFDAMRFLQGCARGIPFTEILSGSWAGGQQIWQPIRGNEKGIFNLHNKSKAFEINTEWQLLNSGKKNDAKYLIEIGQSQDTVALFREDIIINDEKYLTGRLPKADKNLCAGLNMISALSKVTRGFRQVGSAFRSWLSDLHFLDLSPALMRQYVSKNLSEIGIHGENLSPVLNRLAANPEQRQTVLEWIQELCPNEISDFEFIETKIGDVLLAIKEPNGVTISARNMSDGTLRFLAIIVALLTANEGTTFILEEIENDLHPSRLHLLVKFLEQVTASRKLQIIASTHSPYLLDSLTEQTLNDVLVFYRDPVDIDTKVTKLVDITGFTVASKNSPLDLLHASGWMEQNL